MSYCGIIGGEEWAMLGDKGFLWRVEMAVRWRPPSALGMWRILRFVGLVIAFFKYLIARGSRFSCQSQGTH